MGDRENKRIQIFDAQGNFLKEWTDVGYPYGLQKALDNGYRDFAAVDASPYFSSLRSDPSFKQLIQRYRQATR